MTLLRGLTTKTVLKKPGAGIGGGEGGKLVLFEAKIY